jgi:hypothetical protein
MRAENAQCSQSSLRYHGFSRNLQKNQAKNASFATTPVPIICYPRTYDFPTFSLPLAPIAPFMTG